LTDAPSDEKVNGFSTIVMSEATIRTSVNAPIRSCAKKRSRRERDSGASRRDGSAGC
jgi:hypothetical protein